MSQRKVKSEAKPKIVEKDLEIEPEEEPVPEKKRPVKDDDKKEKRAKKVKKAKTEPEPEEEEAPAKKAPAAAAPKKKKAAKAPPTPSESASSSSGEEAPVAAAAAAAAVVADEAPKERKKRGPVKVSNKGVAKGDCLSTVAPFKLVGKSKGKGKNKSGHVAFRESRHLQASNGVLLRVAPVSRIAHAAADAARLILEKEAAPQIARLRKAGKNVPINLTLSSVSQRRAISDGAKRLLTLAADVDAKRVFDMATAFRVHDGNRETLFEKDLELAIGIIDSQ